MNFGHGVRRACGTALILFAALGTTMAAAAELAEAPAHIQSAIPGVRLAGEERFRWLGLSIYNAQLWVGTQGYRPQTPEAAPFAMDLRYARKLYGDRIARSSIDEIRKLGLGTATQHQTWLAQMTRLFPDVEEGSRITGIYLPGTGVRFYFNGKLLGEVSDATFALAFFAIWLDPKTSAPGLRKALLINAAAQP